MSIAVDTFMYRYFSTRRREEKTESAYHTDLKQFVLYVGPDASVDQVKIESVEGWARELANRNYATRSIRRKFAALRVFFGYWVQVGELVSSPLWKVRLDLGRERCLPRALSVSDLKKLVEKAWIRTRPMDCTVGNPRSRIFLALRDLAIIEVLFATGMRVGELVALNLLDWDSGESSFLVNGKGARQRLAVLPDQRSTAVFRRYLECRTGIHAGNDAVLINSSGGRLSTQGVARMLDRLATSAGISVKITPHMLRHTVATLLLRNGADIRVVQELLGHASITTTQQYTHVAKEQLRRALRVHHPNYHLPIAPKSISAMWSDALLNGKRPRQMELFTNQRQARRTVLDQPA
jgi:integrase/recombinase XerD